MPFSTDPCGFLSKFLPPIKMRETSPITSPSGASCLRDCLSWIMPSLFLSLQPALYLNLFPISLSTHPSPFYLKKAFYDLPPNLCIWRAVPLICS